jgi:hypothetical protein
MTIYQLGIATFFTVLFIVDAWFWLVYFPRAWQDGSNRWIEAFKDYQDAFLRWARLI